MIKPNELRIGNYVYPINRRAEIHMPIHNPSQISNIGLFEVELNGLIVDDTRPITVGILDISPIILTEDILLKCGFSKIATAMFGINTYCNYYIIEITDRQIQLYLDVDDRMFIISDQVRYLHQLQNLYFSLTGQELEVKL